MTRKKALISPDGHTLDCWETFSDSPVAQIIILQEIFGVTDQLKEVASNLAAHGFSVLIPQLFDRHAPNTVIPFSEAERGRVIMASLNPDETFTDIQTVIAYAQKSNLPVFIVGFCWGGGLAFRSGQIARVSGTISFYGTRLAEYLSDDMISPALLHFGKLDPLTPPDLVSSVAERYPDIELYEYDCGHAFANQHRDTYCASATQLAMDRTVGFIKSKLER
jgi:carboxymethylenebutenolidase